MNFEKNYTFENFIVSSGNEAAYLATKDAAAGVSRQPLFLCICGKGPGTGKTHLLRAIEREIHASGKGRKVLYVTADDFTSELIQSLQRHSTDVFYQKYEKADVLLIDDVHTLAGRNHVQEELVRILNERNTDGKQSVMAVDAGEGPQTDYAAKLRIYFESGAAVELGSPDFEGRMQILGRKLEELTADGGMEIATDEWQEVLAYIAEKETDDMRKLTGALSRLTAHAFILKEKVNRDFAVQVLK